MSDLQTLASETVNKLSTLDEATESIQTKLTAVKTELSRVRQAINEAWETLNERAQSLIEQVNSGKTELASEVETVTQVITQLKQTIDTTQSELTQDLEETKGAIAAIDGRLSEVDIATDIDEAEASLTALSEQEIGTEVEVSIAQTVKELTDFGGELSAFQSGLENRVNAMRALMSDQAVPFLEGGSQAFSEYLDSVVEYFDNKIQTVSDGAEDSIQGLMEQVSTSQDDLFTHLEDTADQFGELMTQLEEAVDIAKTSVVDATETLVEGIECTNETCQKAVELLTDSKDALEAV